MLELYFLHRPKQIICLILMFYKYWDFTIQISANLYLHKLYYPNR